MIANLLLVAAALQTSSNAPAAVADTAACEALVRASPSAAIAAADQWRLRGGGLDARQCLGLAYSAAERWSAAAATLEAAAREAESTQDLRSADLWVQAGNAWLASADPTKARTAFEAALASPLLGAELRGEVHLDRARAFVATGDLAAARSDIDKGLELVPGDPFAWYLSAALARRQNDLSRAQRDIAKAVELAPGDAPVLLEAGNIAGLSGEIEAARALFARAVRAAPNSEAGKAAAAALAANSDPGPAPAQSAVVPSRQPANAR